MAELFLQELEPDLLSRPTADVGYDFFVGFPNSKGGLNTYAVEVKGTEKDVSSSYAMDSRWYSRLVNSNIPALLLVANVKKNRLFYAWPDRKKPIPRVGRVEIPVTEVNDRSKKALLKQLRNPTQAWDPCNPA